MNVMRGGTIERLARTIDELDHFFTESFALIKLTAVKQLTI